MDLTKCEVPTLYPTIDKKDNLSRDAFLSINIDSIIGQALCSAFVECESETSPTSSSVCGSPPAATASNDSENFPSADGELHLTESLKTLLSDKELAHSPENQRQNSCKSPELNNFYCMTENSIETSRFVSVIRGSSTGFKSKIEYSRDLAIFSDNFFPTCFSEKDGSPLPCAVVIKAKETFKADVPTLSKKSFQGVASLRDEEDGQTLPLHDRGRSEQPSSLKKSQNEVAPGWRKPPRPPRSSKLESSQCKSILDASQAYRMKKAERLHGKKKKKAGGGSSNLTLFFALIFTFFFCLLIANSSR